MRYFNLLIGLSVFGLILGGCGEEKRDSSRTSVSPAQVESGNIAPTTPPALPDSMEAKPVSSAIVAYTYESLGQIKPDVELLARKFKDGGSVLKFMVVKLEAGYHLLRIGRNAAGEGYSEALPLVQSGKEFRLGDISKAINCRSADCADCYPDQDRRGCHCFGEGPCTFGVGPILSLEDVLR